MTEREEIPGVKDVVFEAAGVEVRAGILEATGEVTIEVYATRPMRVSPERLTGARTTWAVVFFPEGK